MSSLPESFRNIPIFTAISSVHWPANYFDAPVVASNLTYGLQSALSLTADHQNSFGLSSSSSSYSSYASFYNRYYIFLEPCEPQSDGTSSCFGHCNDTAKMFSSLPYVHNCVVGMVLPNITNSSHLIVTSSTDSEHSNMIITIESNSTTQQIGETLQKCFVKGCDSFPACKASRPSSWDNFTGGAIKRLENDGQRLIEHYLCPEVKSRLDSDIGGVGVYVSYWVQSCLGLLGFVGILMLGFIVPYIHLLGRLGIKRVRPPDCRKPARKHLSRLVVSLTDFHKAQCFFMLATNVAAIVAFKKGGASPQSMQQVYNNYVFLKIIAVSGFLPISFMLFILHLVHMTSWYLISLSCASIALSISTLAVLGTFEITPTDYKSLQDLAATGGPSECGNYQPWIYCYETIQTSSNVGQTAMADLDSQAYRILGFCLVAVVLVVVSKLGLTKRERVRNGATSLYTWLLKLYGALARLSSGAVTSSGHLYQGIAGSSAKREKLPSPPGKIRHLFKSHITAPFMNWWNKYPNPPEWALAAQQARTLPATFRSFQLTGKQSESPPSWLEYAHLTLEIITYLIFLSLYLTYFSTFMRDLAWFAHNNVYNNSWNFGQVVALSVWAPVVAEWVHLEFRGMRRGMEYKLLLPYRITTGFNVGKTYTKTQKEDVEKGKAEEGGDSVDKHENGDDGSGDGDGVDDGFRDAKLSLQAREAEFNEVDRTDSTTTASVTEHGGEQQEEDDREWILPEPELPSRAITLSRRFSGSDEELLSR